MWYQVKELFGLSQETEVYLTTNRNYHFESFGIILLPNESVHDFLNSSAISLLSSFH